MNTGLILHTVLGLLLLLIPAGALYLLERKALKSFGIAIVRMMLQLLVLCLMVRILIRVDNSWLSILWLLLMAFYAAWIVVIRCRNQEDKSRDSTQNHGAVPIIPVSLGLFVGVLVVVCTSDGPLAGTCYDDDDSWLEHIRLSPQGRQRAI